MQVSYARTQQDDLLAGHAMRIAVHYPHKNVVVDELVDVVGIPAIIHGILQGCQVLAMHVEYNVPNPIHPPAPQS